MVGEFPEVQGVMGRYYALHDGEDPAVAEAIGEHYAPKGPGDAVPTAPVSIAVALADKLDLLAAFFGIDEKPTGSSDPYALRRAALGIIRIVRENGLRLGLRGLAEAAAAPLESRPDIDGLLAFLAERLRVQMRAEGARHDVLAAVLGAGLDDDIVRLLARTDAVTEFLATDDGANLLVAYRRAANILRIEEKKDGPHGGAVDTALLGQGEERNLAEVLDRVEPGIDAAVREEAFAAAMAGLAALRPPLDGFFDRVTVNDARSELRRNRLRLLARVRTAMNRAADFSRIEG
jgi:glycyl-tRNA synthetase beta chain